MDGRSARGGGSQKCVQDATPFAILAAKGGALPRQAAAGSDRGFRPPYAAESRRTHSEDDPPNNNHGLLEYDFPLQTGGCPPL